MAEGIVVALDDDAEALGRADRRRGLGARGGEEEEEEGEGALAPGKREPEVASNKTMKSALHNLPGIRERGLQRQPWPAG